MSGGMKSTRRPCATHALLNMHTLHDMSRVASKCVVARGGVASMKEEKWGILTGRGDQSAARRACSRCCDTLALCFPAECVNARWYQQNKKQTKT
jgi:hypothetical protein